MLTSSDTYLDKCKQLIESSLNWGSSANWTNEDFENLSDNIEEKTKVRLSVSTLKRIWGRVKYDSTPTAATLNTLARFVDYENWRDFQQKHKPAEPVMVKQEAPVIAEPQPIAAPPVVIVKTNRGKKLLVAACLAAAVIISLSLITIFSAKKAKAPLTANIPVEFESKKTSDDLPNSVVFNYNASAFHSDSVYLQQNWDPARRQKIPPDGRQVTSIYYYPGYFNSKLIVDGQIKKESPVFIQTKGWKGIIEQKPVPIYLSATDIKGNGAMGVGSAVLQAKLGTPVFTNTAFYLTNVRPFDGTDPADFSFETTLHNTSTVEQSLCRKIEVYILSKNGAIILPLCDKGCIADIGILTGKDYIDGKNHDLSGFGCDMHQFQHLACAVKNGRLKVYLNNIQILDANYKPISDIVGFRYAFEGAGEIKDIKLASHDKVIYQEKF